MLPFCFFKHFRKNKQGNDHFFPLPQCPFPAFRLFSPAGSFFGTFLFSNLKIEDSDSNYTHRFFTEKDGAAMAMAKSKKILMITACAGFTLILLLTAAYHIALSSTVICSFWLPMAGRMTRSTMTASEVKMSLLRSSLEVRDFCYANPHGVELRVESLKTGIAFFPLFSRDIRIHDAALRGLHNAPHPLFEFVGREHHHPSAGEALYFVICPRADDLPQLPPAGVRFSRLDDGVQAKRSQIHSTLLMSTCALPTNTRESAPANVSEWAPVEDLKSAGSRRMLFHLPPPATRTSAL